MRCCREKDGEEEGGGRKDWSWCTLAGDTVEPELVIPTTTCSKASIKGIFMQITLLVREKLCCVIKTT